MSNFRLGVADYSSLITSRSKRTMHTMLDLLIITLSFALPHRCWNLVSTRGGSFSRLSINERSQDDVLPAMDWCKTLYV